MTLKDILKKHGWVETEVQRFYSRSALQHPLNKKLKFVIQTHELLLGQRLIAKLSSQNYTEDEQNGLVIFDNCVALKVK